MQLADLFPGSLAADTEGGSREGVFHPGRLQRCPEQVEEVVGAGHQAPLLIQLLQPSQHETIQPPDPLV